MALNVHLTLPEDSPAGRAVLHVVQTEHVTAEEAVTQILTEAASRQGKTPAEELIGALSSPEDREILERAMASARQHREEFDFLREFVSE